jgi:RNA polymerase sigma-32 factor
MDKKKEWYNYKNLSFEEEKSLIQKWKKEKIASARDKIILHNQHVCYSVARRLTKDEHKIKDLMNEGIFGLMEAIEKFDDTKNVRFSSYARWWVMTHIHKHMNMISLVVDIPSKVFMETKNKKNIDNEAISWKAKQAVKGEIPLDAPLDLDNNTMLMDTIIETSLNPEESCLSSDLENNFKSKLNLILNQIMTKREKYIIEQRVLIEEPRTLAEIAVEMNISRERIRQIEKIGLRKLQKKFPDQKILKELLCK